MLADGGQVTLEYANVCRLRYQSQLRMHKYCMRPPLIRLSDDEGGIGDGAGKLSTWSTKARTENMSDWKLCKEFPLWVFGISVCGANLDLVNNVVILTHLSGLYCCCVVLSISCIFHPFSVIIIVKGLVYRSQCFRRSWIRCDITLLWWAVTMVTIITANFDQHFGIKRQSINRKTHFTQV